MADLVGRVQCPLCREMIPITTPLEGAEDDLSITVDPVPMETHVTMHSLCRCIYSQPTGDRVTSEECVLHRRVVA